MYVIIVTIIALLCQSFSPAYALDKFVTFPGIGECTGTYVRYREDPDTESEIVGRLNEPDRVIVLSSTAVDGELWYEIEDPKGEATAFVYGKYIRPLFGEDVQRTDTYKFVVGIMQDYGITKEKAAFYNGPEVKTRYKDGYLVYVDARKNGCAFGDIHIGDDAGKVEEILGYPEDDDDENEAGYMLEDYVVLMFRFRDGKVTRMTYEY